MVRRAAGLATVALWLLVAGCGSPDGVDSGEPPPQAGGDQSDIDWTRPLEAGVPVEKASEARVAFLPEKPSDALGSPELILTTDPQYAQVAVRQIAWTYDHPKYGRFIVWERVTDEEAALAEWREMAAETPGCTTIPPDDQTEQDFGVGAGPAIHCVMGERSFVTLEDGREAFVLNGPEYVTLHWLQPLRQPNQGALDRYKNEFRNPALDIFVLGPTLTPEQAIEIANNV